MIEVSFEDDDAMEEIISVLEANSVLVEHDKQIRAETFDVVLKSIEMGIEATGHTDSYTTGFCNALIWLKSCITSEEPQFFGIEPKSVEQLKEQING